MSTAAPAAVTPDDLLRMGDEGKGYELVDGELKERTVGKESGRIAARICTRLSNHCEPIGAGIVFTESTSYRCFPDDPGRVRRADVSFISFARMPAATYEDEGHCTTAPDLAVEVVSPNDLYDEVEAKRDEWLAAGVREVWIVNVPRRTVRVHRADGGYAFFREADTLTTGVPPGFSCPAADLFRLPGGAAPPGPVQ